MLLGISAVKIESVGVLSVCSCCLVAVYAHSDNLPNLNLFPGLKRKIVDGAALSPPLSASVRKSPGSELGRGDKVAAPWASYVAGYRQRRGAIPTDRCGSTADSMLSTPLNCCGTLFLALFGGEWFPSPGDGVMVEKISSTEFSRRPGTTSRS